MSDRKRIPQISLPTDTDNTPTAYVIGIHILFVGMHRDESPSNPLEDCDGIGSIDAITSRRLHGISRDTAMYQLWDDYECIIPLKYRDYSYECKWEVHPDAEEIYTSIRVAKNTAILLNKDESEARDEFYPDWHDNETVDGIWTPDKYVRESYTGQDGLSLYQWMVKQAEGACEQYTDYCNGNVYGYDIRIYKVRKDDDGDIITDFDYYEHHKEVAEDSCWGFYGWDYFRSEVADRVKSMLKHHLKISRRAIAAAFNEVEGEFVRIPFVVHRDGTNPATFEALQ